MFEKVYMIYKQQSFDEKVASWRIWCQNRYTNPIWRLNTLLELYEKDDPYSYLPALLVVYNEYLRKFV